MKQQTLLVQRIETRRVWLHVKTEERPHHASRIWVYCADCKCNVPARDWRGHPGILCRENILRSFF
jgi:hypothetical protein